MGEGEYLEAVVSDARKQVTAAAVDYVHAAIMKDGVGRALRADTDSIVGHIPDMVPGSQISWQNQPGISRSKSPSERGMRVERGTLINGSEMDLLSGLDGGMFQ